MTFERSLVSGLSLSIVALGLACSQGSTLARGGTGGGGNNTGSGGYGTGGGTGSGGYATGGSFGTGGYATGGSFGTGGLFATGGSTSSCTNAVATGSDPLIDDLTDNDNAILQTDNRIGYWYDYSDGTAGGVLTPANTAFLPETDPADATNKAVHVVATGFSTWGAGFGFGLVNTCTYDATPYTGVTFKIKGSGSIRFQVSIPGTTSTTSNPTSGACPANCDNHFGFDIPLNGSTTWETKTYTWAQLTQQTGWGTVVPFTVNQLIALQWQVNGSTTAASAGDVWIDDIAFTKP